MGEKGNATVSQESEPKVGVYICHCGGNISDHVDVEALRQKIEKWPGVAVARTNTFMCSDPGQELILEDLTKGLVNRVVVASCAPSLHETTFRAAVARAGANPYLYEHANIREQVSWVHHGDPATDKAACLVAAAVEKAKYLKELEPIKVEAKRHVTVIGGGVAGLKAAADLSMRGLEVALIEKSPFLGGQTAKLDKLFPTQEFAADLIQELVSQVLKAPNIKLYTCAEVIDYDGYVGNFKLTVERKPPEDPHDLEKLNAFEIHKKGVGEFLPFAGVYPMGIPVVREELSVETGVILFATGFKTYEPSYGEYGFGKYNEVITLPDLIEAMAKNQHSGRHLQINGRKIRRVAMIHCVGSRQIPGIHEPDKDGVLNEYCSRVCCSATLQAASEIRERFPQTFVFEYYRDIRTYGRGQEEYYERASNNGVVFFRFEPESPPQVKAMDYTNSDYPLKVTVSDTLTFGEEIMAEVDLVVLSVGMKPNDISHMIDIMKLPVGADQFLLEVHPKLRPVELSNLGMLLSGTCQSPMDIGEACASAQAASAKASNLLSRGYVELDPFVAEVNVEKCSGCELCVAACPIEGALKMTELQVKGEKAVVAQVVSALCTGCGICVGACPENAIDVNGWTLKQYEAMVDAIVSM